jgi:hypothetical protein
VGKTKKMDDKEVADEIKTKKEEKLGNKVIGIVLGRDAPQSFVSVQTFRKKILPPSSGSKNRPNKHAAIECVCGIYWIT